MKRRLWNKALSGLLTFAMVVGMMPAFTIGALAAKTPTDTPEVYHHGTQPGVTGREVTLKTVGGTLTANDQAAWKTSGSYSYAKKISAKESLPVPVAPANSGTVKFAGWYDDINYNGNKYTRISSANGVDTLYAKWEYSNLSERSSSMWYQYMSDNADLRGLSNHYYDNFNVTDDNRGYEGFYRFGRLPDGNRWEDYSGTAMSFVTKTGRDIFTELKSKAHGTGIYVAQVMAIEGNYVTINYIVENRSNNNYITSQNPLSLGAVADVMIDSDDQAKVVRAKTNEYTYLQMSEGDTKYPKVFRLFLEGEDYGVTDVDRYWVGFDDADNYHYHYNNYNYNGKNYRGNAFNDTSAGYNNGYDANFHGYGDSALAYSWTLESLAPGESVVKTVKLGVGDLESMKKVNLTLNANGGEFVIEGLYEEDEGVDMLPLSGTALTINEDDSVTVDGKTYPVPQREGYSFDGWVYANGNSVPDGAVKTDTSIYASWKELKYDVTNNTVICRTLPDGTTENLTSPTVTFKVDGTEVEQAAALENGATWGQDLSVEMSVPDGYLLPQSITVTVDGKTLTPDNDYQYDIRDNQEKASLRIDGSEITGDVVITAVGRPVPAELPDSFVAYVSKHGKPTSVTIEYGESVDLVAKADPVSIRKHDFDYQWYMTTDRANQGGEKLSGETDTELTVGNDLSAGSYYYYCVLTSTRSNGEVATMTTEPVLVSVAKRPTATSLSISNWRYGDDQVDNPSVTVYPAAAYDADKVSVVYYMVGYGHWYMTDRDIYHGGAAEKGGKPTLPGTYYAIASYEGGENYDPSMSKPVKFTIYGTLNVPMDDVTAPNISDLVYNGTWQKPAIWNTHDYTVVENNGGKNAGEYTVTLEIRDKEHYRWADAVNGAYALENDNTRAIVKYRITPATNEFTTPLTLKNNTVAFGSDPGPFAEAKFGTVEYQYSQNKVDWYDAPTGVGDWFVRAFVPADQVNDTDYYNYLALESTPLAFTVVKADRSEPTGLTAVHETIAGLNDGGIRGLDTTMEYSVDATNWTDVSDPGMDLAPGTYYVRYKETSNYKESASVTVIINSGSVLTVTFNSNGGSAVESQTVAYGDKVNEPADPTRTGYRFDGWKNGDKKWNFDEPITGSITLVAQWKANKCIVIFSGNGGSFVDDTDSRTYYQYEKIADYDETLVLNNEKPFEREGYTFAGWEDNNGTSYRNGQTITLTGDITLHAQWKPNKYQVIFIGNGGSFVDDTDSQTYYRYKKVVSYDENLVLGDDEKTFTREDYTFAGWNTKDDGSGVAYADRAVVRNLATGGRFTLYAQWVEESKEITVTFCANDGSGETKTQIVSEGQDTRLAANTFTYEGHTFAGWKDENGVEYSDGEFITLTDDITLYAQWVSIDGTVTVAPGTGFTASPDMSDNVSYDGSFAFDLAILPGYGGTPTVTYNGSFDDISVVDNQNGTFTVTISGIRTFGTVTVSGIRDVTKPYVSVTMDGVTSDELVNPITFEKYFSGEQTVSITASGSQSGVKSVEYLISSSDTALTEDQLENSSEWKSGSSVMIPAGSGKQVVYARVTDNAGNISYASTNGAIFDNVAPVIDARTANGEPVASGSVVTGIVTVTVTDDYGLESVTGAGTPVNGIYTLDLSESGYTLVATDKAGNVSYFSVTSADEDVPTFDINGSVSDSEAGSATVKLMQGNTEIKTESITLTASGEVYTGTYEFRDVRPGAYNIVVTKGDRTMTVLAVVEDHDLSIEVIVMPTDNKNSVLDNSAAGEFAAIVGGLDELAHNTDLDDGESEMEIKLTVTAELADNSDADHRKIQQMAPGRELRFIDLTLTKQIDGNNPVDIGDSNDQLLTIVIPFNLAGKDNVMVYRCHNGIATAMTRNPAPGEEGFEVGANSITIYAKRFSAYAIGYTATGVTPPAAPITPPSDEDDSAVGPEVTIRESENGSVVRKIIGSTVIVTPKPEAGYVLDVLEVTDKNGNKVDVTANPDGTYSFNLPASGADVKATFAPVGSYTVCVGDDTCPIHPYTDAQPTAWYHDGVHYCIDHGIMNGYGNGIFNPNGAVTRQQVWLTLARLSGETPANAEEARAWAMENGVSDGTNPTNAVTRQQFITMLYRFAVDQGYDVSVGEETNILSYTDAFDVAEYAIPAVQWGCGSGIMGGYTDGTLKPATTTTRAHLAAFLQRFCVSA